MLKVFLETGKEGRTFIGWCGGDWLTGRVKSGLLWMKFALEDVILRRYSGLDAQGK